MKDRIREKLEAAGLEVVSPPANRPSGFQGTMTEEQMAVRAEETEKRNDNFKKASEQKPVAFFTYEQVQQMMAGIIAQQAEQTKTALVEFAKELRKASPEEEAKLAEAKLRRERLVKSMVESAKVEEESRRILQTACSHKKPNGIVNFGGQVHGRRVRLICKTCFKELVNREATPEDIQNGPLELLVENQRMGLNV